MVQRLLPVIEPSRQLIERQIVRFEADGSGSRQIYITVRTVILLKVGVAIFKNLEDITHGIVDTGKFAR